MSHHVKLFSHTVTFNPCHDPIILVDRWGNRVTEMSLTFPRWHKHYVRIIMWIQAIQLHNLNHSTILTLMKSCLLSQIPLVPATMLNPHSYKSWKQVSITKCHLPPWPGSSPAWLAWEASVDHLTPPHYWMIPCFAKPFIPSSSLHLSITEQEKTYSSPYSYIHLINVYWVLTRSHDLCWITWTVAYKRGNMIPS